MNTILESKELRDDLAALAAVTLDPARHLAPNARVHSLAVAQRAVSLGRAAGASDDELHLLRLVGLTHDLGKLMPPTEEGEAHPTRSVQRLRERYGVDDARLLSLVRYHDLNLPWYLSAQRGEAPSDRAWRRLAGRVDLWLLALQMLADRVDCRGGYKENAPLCWFLDRLERRALLSRPLPLALVDALGASCETAVRPSPSTTAEGPRLGLDIGRVIIGPPAGGGRPDTRFLDGDEQAALATPPMPGAFDAIARLVQAYQGRVWLVSKAGPRIAGRTQRWLAHWHFFELTGLPPQQLRFCRRREDKAPICAELGLEAFVDDRADVLSHLRGLVPKRLRFGNGRVRGTSDRDVLAVTDWPAVTRTLLGASAPG